MPEPSVLDYVKAKLMPWRGPAPEIGALPKSQMGPSAPAGEAEAAQGALELGALPWRTPLALLLLMLAQRFWAPVDGSWLAGLPLAMAAFALVIWALREGEWRLPQTAEGETQPQVFVLRRGPLAMSLVAFALAFLASGGNRFTFLSVSFWLAAVGLLLATFWQSRPSRGKFWTRLKDRLQAPEWSVALPRFTVLLLLAFGLAAFFRFSQLDAVPPEMVSDHAEKLLDVMDIQGGETRIFFPRNTGREPLQFYLTAAIADWPDTGNSYLSLKIGMAGIGLISLVYSYLLGKEFGGRWVGLLALLLTGMAYWPNVLARVALRFILYPAFAAPTLYYLLRALRRGQLNDYLLCGLFLGAGFYGYTAFRILPLLLLAALGLFLLHIKDNEQRRNAISGFAVLAMMALVVLTPLLRYSLEPDSMFNFRASSRLLTEGGGLPASAGWILLSNLWKALIMPVYSGGNVWMLGLTRHPTLDLVSGALYLIGVLLVGVRYARTRQWQDLFLLLAVPMLMLPSALSLAFPEENPIMNRAGGALVPIFIICALALDALLHGIKDKLGSPHGLRAAWGLGALLLVFSAGFNYNMVFNQYADQYARASWNSSEMGELVGAFTDSVGEPNSAWVIAYPHWVDTRLVALHAGQPGGDLGIWPDELNRTLGSPYPKLFLLNVNDADGLTALQAMYPQGEQSVHESAVPGKEFLVYFVGSGG